MSRKRWHAILDRTSDDAVIVEVGVWRGDLSVHLLAARPRVRMILVDPWASGSIRQSWLASGSVLARSDQPTMEAIYASTLARLQPYRDRIRILRMPSIDAALCVENASCGGVFIDAEHSADAVAADLAAWRAKVAPGGWIGGHDYGEPRFPGVAAAVDAAFGAVERDANLTWFVRL